MKSWLLLLILLVAVMKAESERCKSGVKPYHLITHPLNYIIKQNALDGKGPFLNVKLYPEVLEMATSWRTIYDEFEKNLEKKKPIKGERFFVTIIDDDKWKRIKLKFYGQWKHEDTFPETIRLLKKIPGLKAAMISVLEPGCVIKPHVGITSACARVHVGLQCPIGARLKIMDNFYEWRVGEVKMFDDTYLHGVVQNGDFDRVVLFLDVERKTTAKIAQNLSLAAASILAKE